MRWRSLPILFLLACVASSAAAKEGPKTPEVGKKAPDFRLNDQHGKAVRFREMAKGKWAVLAFFPKADTPG